jgi:NCS2 family nucleobase:cation symporter-2
MAKKPANLLYGVDDIPPVRICILLAIQHIFFLTAGLIVVSIALRQIGCPTATIQNVVSMSMIAGGIATILQALKKGPVGSGYLCTEGTDPSFISVSVLAGATGGLSLIFGMTIVSGVIECILARVMHRLRILLPPEVTGVVLTMVAFNVLPIMMLDFFGLDNASQPIETVNVAVALITLGVMVATNVWCTGKLRLYSVIIGIFCGYIVSIALGVLRPEQLQWLIHEPLFSLPDLSHVSWSFDIRLLIPIIVVTLASTLKSVATLSMCQKINDAEWTRPDLDNIGKGTMADGMACVLGGAMGAMGKSLYAASAGLSVATGVTSRVVAFYTGGIYIGMAFLPQLSGFFSIMPKPVMGGALVFMVCFMVISGFQIMTSRMIDIRRTFVIAVSLMFGMSVDIYPEVYHHVHPFLKPLVSSSLSVTTVLAIVLNLVMRLGIARRASIELAPGTDVSQAIFRFMENQGAAWGARKDVIHNAVTAMNEFMEATVHYDLEEQKVRFEVGFDEYNLDVRAIYTGPPMAFPTERPEKAEIRTDPGAVARLAGFLVRQYTDKLTTTREGRQCLVDLHYNH